MTVIPHSPFCSFGSIFSAFIDRENLTAFKGNDAAKRFVEELNQAEDELQTARKDQGDLEKQRDAAQARLDGIIAKLSFDTDLDMVTSKTQ